MTSNSGIYRIVVNRSTSGLTQKYYVGHSSDLGKRRRVHFRLLKKGDHPNPAMQAAWQKYGEIAFGFEIVLECSRAELIAAEQAILDQMLKNVGHDNIFNVLKVCVTSRLGVPTSAEASANLSASLKKRWQDPSYREAQISALKATFARADMRDKMSRIQTEMQNRPEMRRRQAEVQLLAQNRPEVKVKKSLSIRASLATEESKKKRRMTNQRLDVRYRRSRAAMQREQRRRLAALGDHP